MRFQVRGDRILLLLDEMKRYKEIVLPSGEVKRMELPDNHSERSRTGVIKAVGEGTMVSGALVPVKYLPGDRVVVSVYAGTRIHLLGEEFEGQPIDEDRLRVIREEEVVCQVVD